jgi:hypothetical protein
MDTMDDDTEAETGDWKVARTGRQECLPYIVVHGRSSAVKKFFCLKPFTTRRGAPKKET